MLRLVHASVFILFDDNNNTRFIKIISKTSLVGLPLHTNTKLWPWCALFAESPCWLFWCRHLVAWQALSWGDWQVKPSSWLFSLLTGHRWYACRVLSLCMCLGGLVWVRRVWLNRYFLSITSREKHDSLVTVGQSILSLSSSLRKLCSLLLIMNHSDSVPSCHIWWFPWLLRAPPQNLYISIKSIFAHFHFFTMVMIEAWLMQNSSIYPI